MKKLLSFLVKHKTPPDFSKDEPTFLRLSSQLLGSLIMVYAIVTPFLGFHPGWVIAPIALIGLVGEWNRPWKKHFKSLPERIGDLMAIIIIFSLGWIQNNLGVTCSSDLPLYFQLILSILIMDGAGYGLHYWAHKNSFLWHFHKVHHSRLCPSLWNASWEHIIDAIFRLVVPGLTLVFCGFDEYTVLTATSFSAVFGTISHLNVRLIFPSVFSIILVTPISHRIHHHKDEKAVNCGAISHLFDHIFGTYKFFEMEPGDYGLDENEQVTQGVLNIFIPIKKK